MPVINSKEQIFTKYLAEFAKNTDSIQTHLSFNKGKYNIPDSQLNEFNQK
jgi:hypothetical protein